jgi:iron-regulated transporter 1
VLFLAAIYPDTLLPMSVYALVRGAAAMVFSPAIGGWIDSGDRLVVVRTSIIGQRLAVAASCALFLVMLIYRESLSRRASNGMFAVVVLLSCIEKLCSVMNLVSVERDWVGAFWFTALTWPWIH